jgi:hypothetical protein
MRGTAAKPFDLFSLGASIIFFKTFNLRCMRVLYGSRPLESRCSSLETPLRAPATVIEQLSIILSTSESTSAIESNIDDSPSRLSITQTTKFYTPHISEFFMSDSLLSSTSLLPISLQYHARATELPCSGHRTSTSRRHPALDRPGPRRIRRRRASRLRPRLTGPLRPPLSSAPAAALLRFLLLVGGAASPLRRRRRRNSAPRRLRSTRSRRRQGPPAREVPRGCAVLAGYALLVRARRGKP